MALSTQRAASVPAWVLLPHANTAAMNLHLAEISAPVTPGAQAVVQLDGAGWHRRGDRLLVSDNISLLPQPPNAPELNAVENIWQYLRQNYLANRVFASYEAILDACYIAWNALMALPNQITPIAAREWAEVND